MLVPAQRGQVEGRGRRTEDGGRRTEVAFSEGSLRFGLAAYPPVLYAPSRTMSVPARSRGRSRDENVPLAKALSVAKCVELHEQT